MTGTLPRSTPTRLGVSETAASPPLARFDGLSYWYPGATHPALDTLDLSIEPGLTVVAGDSGSGKSSLLRVLNGLGPHFHGGRMRGDAAVGGMSVAHSRTRDLARLVGFVFQDPERQFVYTTVDREVAFGPENLGLPRAAIGLRVEEALADVGIEALRHRDISTLSGGERQRVAIAAALAMGPGLLALDEPLSQLDPAGARAVVEACLHLAGSGASLVVSEHHLEQLLPLADNLLLMTSGRGQGPAAPRRLAAALSHPPQVTALGARLGWNPLPLSVAEARSFARPLRHADSSPDAARGSLAWEARDLTLLQGGNEVLAGIDLAGLAGEVVVLMGDNGSGKTTLLRAIAGLHRPVTGRVEHHLAPGRRVAYLPQDPTALLHRPTLWDEVELTLSRAGSGDAGRAALLDGARQVVDELGLANHVSRYPRDFSGGERQRAALAAILAGNPGLALLDEPTRGMDGLARRALTRLITRLKADGGAVVLATHDSELAAELADRVVRLEGGVAADLGPPLSALAAGQPAATQVAQLYPGGPVTVEGVLRCL
jgi:energy-coupling factor transporter ATP-binding protein EcfA2